MNKVQVHTLVTPLRRVQADVFYNLVLECVGIVVIMAVVQIELQHFS
jgi:hypothetical protein